MRVLPFSILLPVLLGAACGQADTEPGVRDAGGAESASGHPAEASAAFARARKLFALDQPFEAIAEMRTVIAKDPDWAEAQLALGKLLVTFSDVRFSTAVIDRGRLEEAIQHLERACELDPASADAAYWAGAALRKADRGPEAIRRLEKAILLRPDHGLALKELGLLYGVDGDTQRSIGLLERARGVLPKDDDVLFQLALQLEAEDRLEEARDAFLAAAKLNPIHPGPPSGLVRIYRRLGDPEASERMQEEFDRCRAFGKKMTQASLYYDEHTREPGACMGIAEIYREGGMPEQAVLWAERAWHLDQTCEPALELLRKLGKSPQEPDSEIDGELLDRLRGLADPKSEQ